MLLVETNVLVDVLEDDPEWADWSIGQLRAQLKIHRLAINPIIYSELSLTFSTRSAGARCSKRNRMCDLFLIRATA